MSPKYLILVGALLALPAYADTLGLHLGSKHTPSAEFCNANPGLYYRTADGWTVGAYKNSECRRWSAYVGRTWEHGFRSGWAAAITLGGVTGYRAGAVVPLAVPSLRTPALDGWALRLGYVPRTGKDGAEALHMMLEKTF